MHYVGVRWGTPKKSKAMKKFILLAGVAAIAAACNVTRVVTTQAEYFQKGDTTCTIVTKTVESYDASKKL